MNMPTVGLRPLALGLVTALVGLSLWAPVQAEDLKGKYYLGGNLSFLSTTDDIRSNSAIIFSHQFGDDGIPFTGDPNELQGCSRTGTPSFTNDPFCDPRPDDLLARETAIEETFKLDLTGGFGLTSWLSLQVDASYFKADVGPIDVFLRDAFPVSSNPLNPTALTTLRDRETVIPVQAGKITEIPVSLTGVVRFRKDSPLNPYIGVGAGMIFAEMDVGEDVASLNSRLASMRVRFVGNERGNDIPGLRGTQPQSADGRVPFTYPVSVKVEDAFEWHLIGGAEYFLNDRISLVFDARYSFADQNLLIEMAGEDQVNLIIYPEPMFRQDGSLKVFNARAEAPNTLCSEAGPNAIGCAGAGPFARVNPHSNQRFTCPTVGDFDDDGRVDQCYNILNASPRGVTQPSGMVVVQGGKIDLTGFAVAIGARFHF